MKQVMESLQARHHTMAQMSSQLVKLPIVLCLL